MPNAARLSAPRNTVGRAGPFAGRHAPSAPWHADENARRVANERVRPAAHAAAANQDRGYPTVRRASC